MKSPMNPLRFLSVNPFFLHLVRQGGSRVRCTERHPSIVWCLTSCPRHDLSGTAIGLPPQKDPPGTPTDWHTWTLQSTLESGTWLKKTGNTVYIDGVAGFGTLTSCRIPTA